MLTEPPFRLAAALALPARRLPCRTACRVLGIAVSLEADDPTTLRAAARALRGAPLGQVPRRPLRLVFTQDPDIPLDGRLLHQLDPRGTQLFAGAGAAIRVCPPRRAAVTALAPDLLAEPVRLQEVVRAGALALVTPLDRFPIHAAVIARRGVAVLVTAAGGTGKSTLAYAAARAGLTVPGDDIAFVQLVPRLTVRTLKGPMFLPLDARARFPELAAAPPVLRASGKLKLGWRTTRPRGECALHHTALCILERGEAVQLEALTAERAVADAARSIGPGFDLLQDGAQERFRAVARGGAWRLTLGSDTDAAVDALRTMLATVPAR